MLNNLKTIILLNLIIMAFSTESYTQDWLERGLKVSVGLSGIAKEEAQEYRQSISTSSVKPGLSFSVGIVNSFHIKRIKKFSLNVESLYNYSAFEELFIHQSFNSTLERFSTEHIESRRIATHSLLFPVKLNFNYKKFQIAGGIVNTINFESQSNYIYTIEDLETGSKGILYENNLKAKIAKKSEDIGRVYLERIYNLQFVLELGFSITDKHKIGIECMNYYTENYINHVFWSEDVVQHNRIPMSRNMVSITYMLSL